MKIQTNKNCIYFKLDIINHKNLIPARSNFPTKVKSGLISIVNKKIPQIAGIYFLFDKDKTLIYIGQARNIRKRVAIHISEESLAICSNLPSSEVEYIYYLNVNNYNERNILEALYIYFYNPMFNSTKFNKSKNLRKTDF